MTTVACPVCGMAFPEEDAEALGAESVTRQGTTYWFDSPTCRKEFVEEPDAYV